MIDELKNKKEIIYIGGTGNIDECDHCGKEYCSGVSGFDYKFNDLSICDDCLKIYYIVENE